MSEAVTRPDRNRRAAELTITALRDVTGSQLYRRNAFRITGLPTDADRSSVRQRQRQVLAMLEAGVDLDLGHSDPVSVEEVRTAFERLLNHPHRRLVDEVFWLWGSTTSHCGCSQKLHQDHDAAVQAHSTVLALEARGDDLTDDDLARAEELWAEARRLWGVVLLHTAFWDHIRARIQALDERQLDESVLDILREQVPLTLLQPLIDLVATATDEQGWLADQARAWPGVPERIIDEKLEDAAAPHYDAVNKVLEEAGEALDAEAPERAASILYREGLPRLKQLEQVVPHHRHRRTARVRSRIALVFNNCAVLLMDRNGPAAQPNAGKWLDTARTLTSDPHERETIDANRAELREMAEVFELLRAQVSQLLAAGRPDLARAMLLRVKQQLAGGPGTAEIDQMLASLPERSVNGCAVLGFLLVVVVLVIMLASLL